MRKIATLLLLVCFAGTLFAGGTADKRNKCNFFTKRYKSVARISILVPLCYQSNASCNGNYREYLHPQCSQNCGFQEAWAGPGGLGSPALGTYGYITRNICSRGELMDDLSVLMLPDQNGSQAAAASDKIEESLVTIANAEFIDATRTIQLLNISGHMVLQKGYGMQSKASFSVWRPTDDTTIQVEDTVMDASEVLRQLQIRVTDNGVVFSGNLYTPNIRQFFTIRETATEISVDFSGINLNVPIPASIPFDEVAVRIEGDGLPNNTGNLQTLSSKTQIAIDNKNILFDVYPNPTGNVFNIEFLNYNEGGMTNIQLFDVTGKRVREIFKGEMQKNEKRIFNADLSNLPSQTYYVYIESGGQKLIRSVVKQ
ncbi:hypothetical protein DBR32_08790 [Taibaiella sp. KBW10]|uniref:T9SS type A sorting domain-containing protein n=1 Tax=Taibaiella sp. KBW10 TaxID=2153357 RepID=UPI000F595CA7|nr:T9SS type A sorting domain-containing protein [Taibaiella sp. KBW10]RQO30808.1 hypothetical protein DBR32_08790 [Taibaiella sp. KBW10]